LFERRHIPIQVPQPSMQRRIPGADISNIAFEVLHVYRIEPNDCRVETDIRFSDVLSEVKGGCMLGYVGFSTVECAEEGLDGFFITFLNAI
jgi:hypothetical protein